jgi:hypothetical protein
MFYPSDLTEDFYLIFSLPFERSKKRGGSFLSSAALHSHLNIRQRQNRMDFRTAYPRRS